MYSLKNELLRDAIEEQRCKLLQHERDFGYAYLHVTTRCSEQFVKTFLAQLQQMVRTEEEVTFHRHRQKWCNLTNRDFPLCAYFFDYSPRFPYYHTDEFWCKEFETNTSFPRSRTSDQFTNETSIAIPDDIARFLEKGPNYRVPISWVKNLLRISNCPWKL